MSSVLGRKHGMEQEARDWRCEELLLGDKTEDGISSMDIELTSHSEAGLISHKSAGLRVEP